MLYFFKQSSIYMKLWILYFPIHRPTVFETGLPEICLGDKGWGFWRSRKKGPVKCHTSPSNWQGQPSTDFRLESLVCETLMFHIRNNCKLSQETGRPEEGQLQVYLDSPVPRWLSRPHTVNLNVPQDSTAYRQCTFSWSSEVRNTQQWLPWKVRTTTILLDSRV